MPRYCPRKAMRTRRWSACAFTVKCGRTITQPPSRSRRSGTWSRAHTAIRRGDWLGSSKWIAKGTAREEGGHNRQQQLPVVAFGTLFAAPVQPAGDLRMKRVLLFLATNLAVMLVLSIVLNVLGIGRFLTGS